MENKHKAVKRYTVVKPNGESYRYTKLQWNLAFIGIFIMGIITGIILSY